jgi:hypothetical protein
VEWKACVSTGKFNLPNSEWIGHAHDVRTAITVKNTNHRINDVDQTEYKILQHTSLLYKIQSSTPAL